MVLSMTEAEYVIAEHNVKSSIKRKSSRYLERSSEHEGNTCKGM